MDARSAESVMQKSADTVIAFLQEIKARRYELLSLRIKIIVRATIVLQRAVRSYLVCCVVPWTFYL